MKLKHLPVLYAAYLLLIIILFSIINAVVDVMTASVLVISGAVFLIMSITVIGFTAIAINNHKQQQLELKNQIASLTKKSPTDELNDYYNIFCGKQPGQKPMTEYIETVCNNIKAMFERLHNLENLLDTTFSKTDLTYVTYKSSLESVIGAFNANLKGIKKRIDVFDYTSWNEGEKSEISIKYISDIENRISQNEEIIDKLDYLISELVSLDDPANFSLSNLNNLIRQTQDYKNINNGGIS